MPWRQDTPVAFWLDPHPGLSGLPENFPAMPTAGIEGQLDTSSTDSPAFAVITVTDRIGFEYRRVVGLNDFVSQRDAAQLLDLPVMTVTRWTASGRLKSRTRNGFTVVRLRDVLDLLRAESRPLRTGRFLATMHAAKDGQTGIESEIIFTSTKPTRARRERKR